ncbi:D-alanine--D-alanine ligase [Pokkaliibacter plantistimulans]|uniref:D-alanine--D-alanine ligase n=1 Tax=Pokkaliibacter plantistimulans TaxID=1635171 RepID=A0ABX5M1D8_9GAMM|nr:D-alanine--D-alanine ligase [Pokkaliibacter plantistimulans]PXF32741.1 D-alanine--D-alanine ligase [Pokkaliibacter plantistimulans]
MTKKLKVAVLFGGRSAEHEVSLQSARNVIEAMDKTRFEPVLIGIDRQGAWYLNTDSLALLNSENPELGVLNARSQAVSLVAGESAGQLVRLQHAGMAEAVDVIFPVLHGPYGEDGSVQGLARLANVPCVGSDILGSAVGMDKDVAKRLLRDAGIPVARHVCLRRYEVNDTLLTKVAEEFGFPVYVKPANMGSSVGVVKVKELSTLAEALDYAFQYDTKVLIEANISGREVECAVLGNDQPMASIAGEIVTEDGFYSYERKYIDEKGATLVIPAALDDATFERIRILAIQTFRALEARGLARVDMFLSATGELFVNEINTIPGFTSISMYPKLWQASGISYTELISRIIELAIEEHQLKSQLKTTGH